MGCGFSGRWKYCVPGPLHSVWYLCAVPWFLANPSTKTYFCQLIQTAQNLQSGLFIFHRNLILGSCPQAVHLVTWPQGVNLDQVSLSTIHPSGEACLTYRKLPKYLTPPALEACISSNLHPLHH